MECLRDCDCGSVVDRDSLEIVEIEGEGAVKSVVRDGVSGSASILMSVIASGEVSGDASSGFAMRRPPKD